MADRTTPVETSQGAGPGEVDDRATLQEELTRRDQEIARLRGLLLTRDEELGTALGRLASLEGHVQQLLAVAGRLQRIPGAARLAKAVLRGLRRLRGRSGG